MNNPPDFWRRDYQFQIACVQPPPSPRKNRRGCLWGGRDCTLASLRRRKDCTERLFAVALSVGRIIPRGSGHVVRASSPPKFLDRDFVGRRRTGTWHNVYCSVREKQGNVVYRQRVLQTVTSLRVVSLVFRGHDLRKIANINPQQEATLSLWKKLVPRESGGNGA